MKLKIFIIILIGVLSLSNIGDKKEHLSEENFDLIFDMGVISTIAVYEQDGGKDLTRNDIRKLATQIANLKFDREKIRKLLR